MDIRSARCNTSLHLGLAPSLGARGDPVYSALIYCQSIIADHHLHDHVAVLVLARKERLERLVDILQFEFGRDQLLDVGQSAGAEEGESIGVGVTRGWGALARDARRESTGETIGGETVKWRR